MPITKREDGSYTADGHTWIVCDYREVDGYMYQFDILCTIHADKVLENVLRKTKLFKIEEIQNEQV